MQCFSSLGKECVIYVQNLQSNSCRLFMIKLICNWFERQKKYFSLLGIYVKALIMHHIFYLPEIVWLYGFLCATTLSVSLHKQNQSIKDFFSSLIKVKSIFQQPFENKSWKSASSLSANHSHI